MISDGPDAKDNPYQPPGDVSATVSTLPARFSIPLAVVLVLVLAGAFLIDVGLGVGALLVAVPSYARALGLSRVRRAAGKPLTWFHRVLGFVGSVVVVLACALAGCVAFFATCTGSLASGVNMELAGWLCFVGFFAAAIVIYTAAWPRRLRGRPLRVDEPLDREQKE